jgi:CBS-domain-containing membrane protein
MPRSGYHWKTLGWQSLWAALAVFVALLATIVLRLDEAIAAASIGATAFIVFIVFMKPGSVSASPRCVIGGHLIGLAAGALVALVPDTAPVAAVALQALAVGLSLFAMAIAHAEHPPAAGTALSIAMYGISWQTGAAVIVSVLLLILVRRLVRPYLVDS